MPGNYKKAIPYIGKMGQLESRYRKSKKIEKKLKKGVDKRG